VSHGYVKTAVKRKPEKQHEPHDNEWKTSRTICLREALLLVARPYLDFVNPPYVRNSSFKQVFLPERRSTKEVPPHPDIEAVVTQKGNDILPTGPEDWKRRGLLRMLVEKTTKTRRSFTSDPLSLLGLTPEDFNGSVAGSDAGEGSRRPTRHGEVTVTK